MPSIKGRNEFIHALHLILDEDSKYYAQNLEEDPCFKNSLLRDGSRFDAYELQKGRQLLLSAEVFYNLRKESIRVRFSHVEEDTELSFASASVYKIEAKGKDLCEVQFFGKFIMCSNNEDTPVLIEPGETRYWVRKINPLKK